MFSTPFVASFLAGLVSLAPVFESAQPYRGQDRPDYVERRAPKARTSNANWWHSFNDPRLNVLVASALEGSFDLQVARSRIAEADAVVTQRLAPLLPTLTWDNSIKTAPLDSLGFQFGSGGGSGMNPNAPTPPELYYTASSTLNLGVEIDLTGRNVLEHRAAKNDRRATKEDLAAEQQRLATQVVSAYYNVVAAHAQLDVVRRQVTTNERLLEVTQVQFDAGQANAVHVLQQRQQVAATKTLLPKANMQLRAFEHQLAVLLGEPPGRKIDAANVLPGLPPKPGVGTPIELQHTRPELRAMNHRLDAAAKRTKVTRRAFVPSLRLQGQAGVQGLHINDWISQNFWNVGAVLSVPLFTGGATYGRMRQAAASERTAAHRLSQATLAAMQQVEDALMREEHQTEALALHREQLQAASQAFDESTRRYTAGLSQYLTVLTAVGSAQQAELSVITAQRDLLAARISLYSALGDV